MGKSASNVSSHETLLSTKMENFLYLPSIFFKSLKNIQVSVWFSKLIVMKKMNTIYKWEDCFYAIYIHFFQEVEADKRACYRYIIREL